MHGWREYAGWAAGAIAALAVLILVGRRMQPPVNPAPEPPHEAESHPHRGRPWHCPSAHPGRAGEGHGEGHGDGRPAPSANGPQRLPDGSVFLPKPAQRQLGVRTLVTEAGELPRLFELNGKVVMDPNAGGKVQP